MTHESLAAKYYYKGIKDGKHVEGKLIAQNRHAALTSISRLLGVEWSLLEEFKAWTEDDGENFPFAHKRRNRDKPHVRIPPPTITSTNYSPAPAAPEPSSLTVIKTGNDMTVVRALPPPLPPPRDVDVVTPNKFFKLKEA
jgi:hypothetical protein